MTQLGSSVDKKKSDIKKYGDGDIVYLGAAASSEYFRGGHQAGQKQDFKNFCCMPGICGTLSNSAPELRCGTLLIVNTYCGQHNFSA